MRFLVECFTFRFKKQNINSKKLLVLQCAANLNYLVIQWTAHVFLITWPREWTFRLKEVKVKLLVCLHADPSEKTWCALTCRRSAADIYMRRAATGPPSGRQETTWHLHV